MEGIIGLIVLIVLLVTNYELVGSATRNLSNSKLRSLIITIANFFLVLLFVFCLPMSGGYFYTDFQDVINVMFRDEAGVVLTLTIIGFCIAICYFAIGAYNIWRYDRINLIINKYEDEVKQLETQLNRKRAIADLLCLVDSCGADINSIENNPEVKDIKTLNDEIILKKSKIQELYVSKSELSVSKLK